jgi:rhomboid protease GluP
MNDIYKREFKEYYGTYCLIGMMVIVFVLMTLAGGSTNYRNLILFGAKVNELIAAGQYWRFITCIFIHIGFTHLFFNVYALVVLGKFAEKIFGHGKFFLIFFGSGLSGSLLSYLLSPKISAGASGAIFGLLGAIVVYGWKNKYLWRSGLLTNLLVVLGINLFLGVVSPDIDNFGHLGGLLGGMVLGFLFRWAPR